MRLPPLPPETLDADARAYHDESVRFIDETFSGFRTRDERGALLGPWTVWIRDPAIGRATQALLTAIGQLDALPKRTHEIVILAVGARYNVAYELYAHTAVARDAGLSERQVAALAAGRQPQGLSDAEASAFDCAAALAEGDVLPGFLYAAADKALGTKGLSELIYLVGAYAYVSTLLNAHDVPAPELTAGG